MNKDLKEIASQVRRDLLRMINGAKSGHPGGSLSCTDYFVALYFSEMHLAPENFTMSGKGEDVFYLSNGHVCPAWYSTLARSGYFPVSELGTLRQLGSRLQGHPSITHHLPGIRTASGSLGQGLSVALGHALAKKADGEKNVVYTLHGDGELQEGQIWEAAMLAASKGVDNIIAAIDYNGQQIDGPVDKVNSLGNLRAKWESFGWIVLETVGNDMDKLVPVMKEARSLLFNGKPVVILLHTEMGAGVDFMTGLHKWHGTAPNDEQLAAALAQLPETLGDY
ncbi:MAG: transketolase [Bacteroidales bacterium]|nr:transketolase [Bacteroidales bacterium]